MEDPNFLDTSRGNLIFTNQFIEFSLRVKNSATIYGIGERRGPLAVPRNGWSHGVWNRDIPPIEGFNLYGDHPIWIVFEKVSNQYFAYVFWNSNAKSFQTFQDKIVIR